MKKYLFFIFYLFIFFSANAQEINSTVNTKYLRPSLTTLFFQPKNSAEKVIVNKMAGLPVINKFDDNRINFNYFSTQTTNENQKKAEMLRYVELASNPILAKWWNRDQNGDFNADFVSKRGGYSAIDADVIQANASKTNRIEMIGAELIGKSYVFLYQIAEVLTMEQVYDKKDAINRQYSNYKPVARDDEGYEVSYNVYAYKLNFNDSVAAVFYNDYWTDAQNHNAQKVSKWSTATFPMAYKTSYRETIRSTQPKDPKSSAYLSKKKKSMNELLEDAAVIIQSKSVEELGMKLEDFKAVVSVFKTKPLSAKLGTKESLYIDQRFFVYEIEMDANGNQNKVRKGVARVKEIADNNTTATGTTKPSVFQQQGGKKLYEGMLMESKEDRGFLFSAGYNSSASDMSVGGINLAIDYRISRISKVPGLAFGIDFRINPMSDVNPGNNGITNGIDNFSGFTYAFDLNCSKEMYFTRKGNIFVKPSIGVGYMSYYFTSSDDSSILFTVPDPDDNSKTIHNKDYEWSSIYVPLTFSLGINLSPNLVLFVKPGYLVKFATTTGNGGNLVPSGNYTDNWGFDKLDILSGKTTLTFNLSYRF